MRNIQPRPSVGIKFHAVLAVNSVYQAGLLAADADRWLALVWALSYFKDRGAARAAYLEDSAVPAGNPPGGESANVAVAK